MNRMNNLIIAVAVGLIVGITGIVYAEAPPMPSQEDIEKARAMTRSLFESEEIQTQIEKTMRESPTQTDKVIGHVKPGQAGTGLPELDSFKVSRSVDLEKIVEQHDDLKTALDKKKSLPSLMIFVSLSMPKDSLRRYVSEASKSGGAVFIRGMVDGSLRKTMETIKALIGTDVGELGILIHPALFRKFNVDKVPAIAVVKPENTKSLVCKSAEGGCSDEVPPHVMLYGNVTLDYALSTIARLEPSFEAEADRYLRRLRGSDS